MAYRISFTGSFDRDSKKFKKQAQQKAEIKKSIEAIIANPACGELMRNSWRGYSNYHFNRSPELRLIYVVYPCCGALVKSETCKHDEELPEEDPNCEGLIEFVYVKTREECNNLYYVSKKLIPKLRE